MNNHWGLSWKFFFIEYTTGVKEELSLNKSVVAYTNPATDQITLKSEAEKITDVIIYNSVGQLIKINVPGQIMTLDISTFSSGIHILEMHKDTSKERHRVLIL